jgi:glycosyltransferase involved in cell wall biosynthesis
MKVLYFTRAQTPHDLRFTRALAKTDHQVFVLCLDVIDHVWSEGISDAALIAGIHLSVSTGLLQQQRKVKKIINEIQPDVIHAGPVQEVAFIAALAGIHPLVTMSWGSDLLLEADRSVCQQLITRYTLNRTDVLVGDCQCVGEKAKIYGYKNNPYFMFPWGVDLVLFSPNGNSNLRQKLTWQDKTVLLSNRAHEPLYDVMTIAQAFVKVSQERPDLRLMLFGTGSQEVQIRKVFQDGDVLGKVYFGGVAPLETLPEVYCSADLYLSASQSDGSSVSLMEALACGLPVMVSDIPGNREWVDPGKQGWLFQPGNPTDLAEMLTAFDKKAPEVQNMKTGNRLLVEKRANWPENFKILLKAYEKAVSLRNQGV